MSIPAESSYAAHRTAPQCVCLPAVTYRDRKTQDNTIKQIITATTETETQIEFQNLWSRDDACPADQSAYGQ